MAEEESVEGEAQRVLDALDAVEAMSDPMAQARVISRLLKDQAERNRRLKETRRRVVLDLRERKVSYRKIAAALGVSLGTVQDIERGYSGSGRDRPRKTLEE
ncbi:helix-turn-helix domain-containing protein [Streptomyces corynorhini]|uniref:Helix-turn-helix domain-containing protein n=1 Tax=Streptomyces corynorhini TaxID=2282652 RepID=A0A370B6S2_9ACTN|nr:helix-turn-helix domain-containing protein [Streptomyces corynorhini]RDG37508.1 helix-turn-helix domain-containing protein [Streptomyces corynorhini]